MPIFTNLERAQECRDDIHGNLGDRCVIKEVEIRIKETVRPDDEDFGKERNDNCEYGE